MSRLQLALNVDDLDASIAFYTRLFGVAPAKVRPGYANFAIADPPLKLVLVERGGPAGSVNHLGVEVEAVDEVRAAHDRVSAAGMATRVEGVTTCCHAVQDKFWIEGGDHAWEIYTVLADAPVEQATACCASSA